MEKVILEALAHLFKQPATEFVATLKGDNGEWKSEEEIKASLNNAYSERLKQVVDEQKGRAVRERMSGAEKFIRDKYGVESGDTLEDRIAKLVEEIESKGGKERIVEKTVELDEDGVKKHPAFQKLLKAEVVERLTTAEKARDEWENKYKTYVQKQEQERLVHAINAKASAALDGIKAALDSDPDKRQKQINMFVAGLRGQYNFKLDEKGDPYPVNDNGEPIEDASFARVTFADLVKRENIFGVHAHDPNKGSSSPSSQPASGKQTVRYQGAIPKSLPELTEALRKESDPSKREALKEAFKANMEAQPAG